MLEVTVKVWGIIQSYIVYTNAQATRVIRSFTLRHVDCVDEQCCLCLCVVLAGAVSVSQ